MIRHSSKFRLTVIVLATIPGIFLSSGPTALAREGDLATRFKVNDQAPLQGIPTEEQRNEDPIEFGYFLQDLTARAEGAFEQGDYVEGSRYYEALATAVPKNALPFRKLCTSSQHLGDLAKAEAYCWAVLKRENIRVHDHFRFLDIALHLLGAEQGQPVKDARVAMIEGSIQHLRDEVAADPTAAATMPSSDNTEKDTTLTKSDPGVNASGSPTAVGTLPLTQRVELYVCQLALRLADARRLTECVSGLSAVGADAKVVASFKWAAAATQGDAKAQADALTEAKKVGVSEATLTAMRNPANVQLPAKPVLPEGHQPGELALEAAADVAEPQEAAPITNDRSQRAAIEQWVAAIAAILAVLCASWLVWTQRATAHRRRTARGSHDETQTVGGPTA